jgi:hypothetical protein
MVGDGLLNRTASESDRRNLELTLTPRGEDLVGRMMRRRRAALRALLEELGPRKRRRLVRALGDLAKVAGEPSDRALWAMGWTTEKRWTTEERWTTEQGMTEVSR